MLQYLGYVASVIIIVSLLMTSIKKLRWINLVGALLFSYYAFFILQDVATGLMNAGIVIIDIYFLWKMYKSKDYFQIQTVNEDKQYLSSFIEFYKEDISKFAKVENADIDTADVKLYVLRNMAPASVLMGKRTDDQTLQILLDYAVPQYRDFKLGEFLFEENKSYFVERGINKLVAKSELDMHTKYLLKMGFVESADSKGNFEKAL